MKVMLLAGGLGTRLREETEYRPKPMIEVGGKPVLWHIMKNFAHFGLHEFVVCAGYKGSMIKEYFLHYDARMSDFTVRLGPEPSIEYFRDDGEQGWTVTVADTGAATMTGGRIKRVQRHLGDGPFIVTYGDGLADVDIDRLLAFHRERGRLATVTVVHPVSRFGVVDVSPNGIVERFREKPLADGSVNAGFMVFENEVLDYLDEDCVLEEEPLSRLAAEGQLAAYRHEGFWQPMDTYRESLSLNELWDEGAAPWKVW